METHCSEEEVGMEKLTSNLKQCMEHQGKACQQFQEMYSGAYSWWKELEKYVDSNYKSLQSLSEQLMEREKQIKMQGMVNVSIGEKRRELEGIETSISERAKELDRLEKTMRAKSEDNQEMLKKFECVAELKERMLNDVQKCVQEKGKELALKEEQLRERQTRINECNNEIKVKEERLKLIENSIDERAVELELRENQLSYVGKLKEKNLESLGKKMDNYAREFGTKERKFESWAHEHEVKVALIESRYKEVDLINKKVNEWLKAVELNEKKSVFLQGLVEERFREVQEKEREFEKRASEFEIKQKESESSGRSANKRVKIVTGFVDLEQLNSPSDDCQSFSSKEKKDLSSLLNEHLKRHELVRNEICTVLQVSSNPDMLALHAIQRNYDFPSIGDNLMFDESFVRRSYILLSELLMNSSRNITPEVREEAMKLARNWKAKMTLASENCLGVLAFLHFLVAYKLTFEADANELCSLLDAVGLNIKASNTSICTVDKEPVSIEKLIQRGEILHAVRHVCGSKLTTKFSPVQLLIDYLDDAEHYTTIVCKGNRSSEVKRKAVDKELVALSAVMECIKECNLAPEFPNHRITRRLGVLENRGSFSVPEVDQSMKRKNTSLSHSPEDQLKHGAVNIAAEGSSSPCRALARTPVSPIAWTRPPRDAIKVNFRFWAETNCGYASAVGRNHQGKALAICYRKISNTDPLMGKALAAHGALTLASSQGWQSIYLEGDSWDIINCLKRSCDAPESVLNIVSASVALSESIGCVVPVWIQPEANVFAHSICLWAAEKNIQNELSWSLMPSCLVSVFDEAGKAHR